MAEVTADGRLNWRSTLDNSDFKKKSLENIDLIRKQLEAAGDTKGLKAYDAAVAATSANENKAREETTKKINKQAEALDNLNSKAKKNTSGNDSVSAQREIQAAINSASGITGNIPNQSDSLLRVTRQNLAQIQKDTDAATRAFKNGSLSLDEYTAKMNKLFVSETQEKELLNQLTTETNKSSKATTDETAKVNEQIGAIQRLKDQIKALKETKASASAQQLPLINQQLQSYNDELKRLDTIGTPAFDKLSKAIDKPTSTLGRLQYAQKLYGDMVANSNNPAIISKYNAKLEETEKQIVRTTNMGKSGFDELGNKIEQSNRSASGFVNGLKSIAAALGLAFAIQTVIQFLSSLKDIAITASGIDRAFSRLGDNKALENLRQQTGGFIADLDLERLTVKANNFNIPLSKLGGFLSFAQERAKATGEDVNKLTDNIIDGLGRKSTRIIDNLGISIVEIQKEFAKTGDFTTAVSNLIAAKAEEAGTHVDTLADKTNKLSTAWDNAKKSVAGYFARLFNQDTPDDDIIGSQTAKLNEQYGLVRKNVGDLTDFQKKNSDIRIKDVTEQERKVRDLAFAYKLANSLQSGQIVNTNDPRFSAIKGEGNIKGDTPLSTGQIDAIKKQAGTLLEVQKNVLTNMRDQNIEAEKRERTAKNILSLAEMEEKVTTLRQKAANIIPGVTGTEAERKKLLDDAQTTQDLIDKIKGKYAKRDARAAEALENQQRTAAISIANAQTSELERVDQLRRQYARQNLADVDSEKQAITDSFAEQRAAIDALNKKYDDYVKKFGQSAANKQGLKKIDPTVLDPIEAKAQADLANRQKFEAAKEDVQSQKQLYEQFEQYKQQYGEDLAKQRYSSDLKGYENYVDFIKGESKKLGTTPVDNALRDYYTKQLPKAVKDFNDYQFNLTMDNLVRILSATETQLGKQKELNLQYERDVKTLQENYQGKDLEQRLSILKRQHEQALDDTKTLAFEQTKIFIDASQNTLNMTLAQLKSKVKELKKELQKDDDKDVNDASKLTPAQRAQIKAMIAGTKQIVQEADPLQVVFAKIGEYGRDASQSFSQIGASLADINPGLADTLNTLGQITGVLGSIGDLAGSISSGNVGGIISGIGSVVSGVIGLFSSGSKSAKESAEKIDGYQRALLGNQIKYNQYLRDQARTQEDINNLTIQELQTREKMLGLQKTQAQQDYDALFAGRVNAAYVSGEHKEKYGGILGIGRKTRVVQDLASLKDADYDELLEKFTKGQLTDSTKDWFLQLQAAHDEIEAIGESTQEAADQLNQLVTGTTTQSISDAIIEGFKNGKKSAADFADDFKGFMQNALVSALVNSDAFKKNIDDFYKDFSAASASDGGLTNDKINALKSKWDSIIETTSSAIDGIEKVTGSLTPLDNNSSTLTNAIKGMTADQADLLAGQFGGLRLTQRETNVILLNNGQSFITFAKQNIQQLTLIEANTRLTKDAVIAMDAHLLDASKTLDQINKKTGSSNSSLEAAGKFG